MNEKKPNIILIMTDQQRFDTIGAHGYDYMVTPNLDRLASKSTSYTKAYACGATCISSRAALFTGMHPHNTGVYTFNDWSHHKSWIHDLKANGYHCVNMGKMHIQPRDEAYGFDERVIVENPVARYGEQGKADDDWGRHLTLNGEKRPAGFHKSLENWKDMYQCLPWDKDENLHKDVFIGNSALSWIERREVDDPFFLQIGFTGPHETYDPLPEDLELYKDREIPGAARKEGELESKPVQQKAQQAFLAHNRSESAIDLRDPDEKQIKEMKRHYYANITLIDRMIGRILDKLEEKKMLEDAIIIFTSDHGDMMGDHDLAYKWFMYDGSVRIPLIICDTRAPEDVVVEDPVSHIDLGPTILKRAGIPVPAYLEGSDINNRESEYVFCEDNNLMMIRNRTHKLVMYIGQEEGELYHIEHDPGELENLHGDPDYREIRLSMEKQLLLWFAESCYRTMGYKNGSGEKPMVHPSNGPFIRPAAIKNPEHYPF